MIPDRVLLISEVASILRRKPLTVAKDVSTHPERVPPYFKLPGSKTPLWREKVVYAWLDSISGKVVEVKKRGRPRREV
jgi:hypothetical protein